jgi:hypothetical protein
MFPAIGAVFDAGERTHQLQTGIETAIALELWHRRHGSWPETLDALVPGLLPAIPIDRTDGQPLRYAVRDASPVLYSIGADRDDDGGRPPRVRDSATTVRFGIPKPRPAGAVVDEDSNGDWVLWPPLPPEPLPPDQAASSDPPDPLLPPADARLSEAPPLEEATQDKMSQPAGDEPR